jgi:hypothetical protein
MLCPEKKRKHCTFHRSLLCYFKFSSEMTASTCSAFKASYTVVSIKTDWFWRRIPRLSHLQDSLVFSDAVKLVAASSARHAAPSINQLVIFRQASHSVIYEYLFGHPVNIFVGFGSLSAAFTQVSCSAYSSTLKMEAICSYETSVYSITIRR